MNRHALRPLLPLLPLALLALQSASAATLTLSDTGLLTGARGVIVSGQSYDVDFRDGTCTALFGGCDDAADFVFNTQASAYAASQALLNQVFNAFGSIDLDPALTRGCEASAYVWQGQTWATCWVLTPLALPSPGQVSTYLVANDIRDGSDAVPVNTNFVISRSDDISSAVRSGHAWMSTWAVWRAAGSTAPQTVPEPTSLLLAALGLALAAAAPRLQRR
jgi:hypothetical protein